MVSFSGLCSMPSNNGKNYFSLVLNRFLYAVAAPVYMQVMQFPVFFIYLTGKSKARYFPGRHVMIAGGILSSLMFIDVGTVMAGLRHGSNDIRLITGILAGMSLPFLLFPAINRLLPYNSGEEKKIIDGIKPLAGIILANCLIFFSD